MPLQWLNNRLTTKTRLVLGFGLMGLTLVAAPLTMYMVQSNRDLQLARMKQVGIAPSKALLRMVQLLQQHRGLSSGVLGGSTTLEAQRAAMQTEADKAVEAFDAIVASDIHAPALTTTWRRAADAWRGLANGVSSRSISGQESFAKHTALIGDSLKLLDLMMDYFGLSYDPTGHDYHLTMALLVHMPQLTEFLGQARARGMLLLAERRITLADRTELIGLISNVERQHEYMARELDKAVALNPQMKIGLGHIAQGSMALAQMAAHLARTQVVEVDRLSYTPTDYFALFTQAIDGQFTLLDQAMVDLEGALQARIAALQSGQIEAVGFIVLVIAFAVWLGTVIVRATKQDIAALEQSEEAQRHHASELEAAMERLKQAQAQVVETERLRAIGQLAGGVAHDFNNILTSILGQVLLLQTHLAHEEIDPMDLSRKLRLVELAALDGAETVRRIQESIRPRGDESLTAVDLNQVIEQVRETTSPRWKDQAEADGRRITVALQLIQVPPVLGNAPALREAITNLLFNALDAMPTGGTITIATTSVLCSACHAPYSASDTSSPQSEIVGECVKLAITDSGVGMSEEVKAHIFEPFFTTKGVRGTGLGLSMVRGIVQRHQGTIQVTSTVGEGTTVAICLPVAESEVQSGQPHPTPPSLTPGRLRVLVIDDEPVLAQTLGDLLHGLGHEATAVTNGAEGLRHLATEHFDLILTDLGMPEMSGWEVAAAVKVRNLSCPVVLVTGWGESLSTEALTGTGVDLVLNKPYTLVALQQILAHARERIGRTESAISDPVNITG